MFLATDLTSLPNRVRQRMHEILTEQNAVAMNMAKIRQAQIAKFYHDNPPASRDGFGGMIMSMDPYWVNYWRWKLGTTAVTQDPDVKKWLLKNNPEFRVRHKGTKMQFASAQIPASVPRSFRKTYESRRMDRCKS